MKRLFRKHAIPSAIGLLAILLFNTGIATAGSFSVVDSSQDGIGADPNFPNPNLPNYPDGYDILNLIGQENAAYTLGEDVKLADVIFTTGYNRWSSADFTGVLPFSLILDEEPYQGGLNYGGTVSYTDNITIDSTTVTGLGSGKDMTLIIEGLSFYGDGSQALMGKFEDSSAGNAVPEPSSALLLCMGMAGIGLAAWWKRK